MSICLGEIAQFIGAELRGNADLKLDGLATLNDAGPSDLSFLANPAYRDQLSNTSAGAVIIHPGQADESPCDTLVLDNPYLGYAKVSALFETLPKPTNRVHPTAIIDETATLEENVSIGANAVIEAHVRIGQGVVIGAACVIGERSEIDKLTRLHANVTIYHDVRVGQSCILHSGSVIGADGFGFAQDQGRWHKIRQIGGVSIADNVEIGANTTIDRGAMSNTIIGNGVKLDNQIQIAHNVEIGTNTAIAASTAIAGSTKIGKDCTIAGGAAITGHITIADGTHLNGMATITKSIKKAGSYSSGTGFQSTTDWKKSVARFRQLDDIAKRIKALEKVVKE